MSDASPDTDSWRAVMGETLRGGPLSLALPVAAAVLVVVLPALSDDRYWLRQVTLVAVLALTVSGLNLSFGFAGEFQVAQVFMFAIGCYSTMALALRGWTEVVPLVLLGGAVAAVVGGVLVLPSLRFGGLSLAVSSYFLVVTIPDLVNILRPLTGGTNGLSGIPAPRLLGHPLGAAGLYEVTVLVAIVWFACFRNLVTSGYGTALRNVRRSPLLAASLGLSVVRLRVVAYTLGAFPAGMAGCLFGFATLVVSPATFDFALALAILAASLLGGTQSVYGAIAGAAVLQLGPQGSLRFEAYAPVAYGVFLMVAAVAFGGGLGAAGRRVVLRLDQAMGGATTNRPTGSSPVAPLVAADLAATSLAPVRGGLLRVQGASRSFDGLVALDDVSLMARPGEVTALIGPNGSGKTTLLNVVCGYVRPDTGTWAVGDHDLGELRIDAIARAGVGRTFQTPMIPENVTTLDVVASGRSAVDPRRVVPAVLRLPSYRRSRRADRTEAMAMLQMVGLGALAGDEASALPLGQQRLVEVARALCGGPRVLLLDEPAAGLGAHEAARLGEVIAAVARAGAAVVLVEHNVDFVRRVADVVHVMSMGAVIAHGSPARVMTDERVVASYLGTKPVPPRQRRASGHPPQGMGHRLEVSGLRAGYGGLEVVHGISLRLRPGDCEVVLGRNGAGKSTLVATVAGLVRPTGGSVVLDGEDITGLSASRRASAGVTLVQEGRRIFRERTVWENVELGAHTTGMTPHGRQRHCAQVLERFPALLARRDDMAGALSGGLQQLLALAQAAAARPTVLLLDEPSTGLSPALVTEIFEHVREVCDAGTAVLLVEQSAEQALAIADRVTVLDLGRVTSSGAPEEFADRRVLRRDYLGG